MKKIVITLISFLLIINNVYSQCRPEKNQPVFPPLLKHDQNFKKSSAAKSFYSSKDDWKHIIDTTWGPGPSLEEKLAVFDAYTSALTEKFDGFNSLGIDPTEWDSIVSEYRSGITDTTSRGIFAAKMSRLAYSLHDVHTSALDTVVCHTLLNPGTPLMVFSGGAEHFGAVLTLLPDSNLVVLRVLEDHPLDLQPGDIILGYEGIPWRTLVDELLTCDIPLYALSRGTRSALRHFELISAGNNWHLFDTVDIIRYSTKDTVHLPTLPLTGLPVPTGEYWPKGENLFMNNEQLAVPGVHLPEAGDIVNTSVSYGIVEGTQIGYIYLYVEGYPELSYYPDAQIYEAVSALLETDGLIIDLRVNFGGWAEYTEMEKVLFNQDLYTIIDAFRCNSIDFELCTFQDPELFEISGNPQSLYDRPIAVLTGPNCASMGDITTHLLDYHPMTRFFGKSACSSLGANEGIDTFPGWDLHYSKSDMYHLNQPDTFLNRREFPVDVPVWFNADAVAAGIDPVVKKAREWIDSLSYAHAVSVQSDYLPAGETVQITAEVENPQNHEIAVYGKVKLPDGSIIDSVAFSNEKSFTDSIWEVTWSIPAGEAFYSVDVTTVDTLAGTVRTLPQVVQFTSAGPVVIDGLDYSSDDTIPNPSDHISFYLKLLNTGLSATIPDTKATLGTLSPWLSLTADERDFREMEPGESVRSTVRLHMDIAADCPVNTELKLIARITSHDYIFWTDTCSILVQESTAADNFREPLVKIYPNPAGEQLNIEFTQTGNSRTSIDIMDMTGKLICTKVLGNTLLESYSIDISALAEGIYFLRVRNDEIDLTEKIIKVE